MLFASIAVIACGRVRFDAPADAGIDAPSDADAAPIDTGPVLPLVAGPDIRVTFTAGLTAQPSLVWNGSEHCIAFWDDTSGGAGIYLARLDPNGERLAPDVRVTRSGQNAFVPSLVWADGIWAAAWEDERAPPEREVYFARLDSEGAIIGTEIRVTNALGYSGIPSLVFTGTEYGIAFADERNGSRQVLFTRLDVDGNVVGAERIVNEGIGDAPALAYNGSGYGVAFEDEIEGVARVYLRPLNDSGETEGPAALVSGLGSGGSRPSLIWNGADAYGVAWSNDDGNVAFTLVGRLGAELSPQMVLSDGGGSRESSVAFTGTEYGVVWESILVTASAMFLTRVDRSGREMGAEVPVTEPSDFFSPLEPSLVWADERYALAFRDLRDLDSELYFTTAQTSASPAP